LWVITLAFAETFSMRPWQKDRRTGLAASVDAHLAGGYANSVKPGSTLSLSLLVSAAIQGLTIFTGVLLARELGAHGRGQLAAILLWPSILAIVGSLGLSESATFHSARTHTSLDALVGTIVGIALLQAAVLVGVGSLVIPAILGHYGVHTVRLSEVYLAYVPLNLLTLSMMGVLNGRHRFAAFHILRILIFLTLAAGLGSLAMFDRLTVSSATATYLMANVLTAAAAGWFVVRLTGIPRAFRIDVARSLVGFGLRSHTSGVSSALNQRLDQLLISALLAPVKLGLYVVAVTLTSATSLIGWSVAMVVLPTTARAQDNQGQEALVRRFISLTVALSTAITLPLVIFTPAILDLFFGDSFRSVANVARVLLVAAVFLSVNRTLEAALQGIGRPLDAGIAEFVALGVTAVGLASLLPPLGLAGAALASLLAYGTSTAWMIRRLARTFDSSLTRLVIPTSDERRAFMARGRRRAN
jgi:O-antigen/teichoic acid export membrane protein